MGLSVEVFVVAVKVQGVVMRVVDVGVSFGVWRNSTCNVVAVGVEGVLRICWGETIFQLE